MQAPPMPGSVERRPMYRSNSSEEAVSNAGKRRMSAPADVDPTQMFLGVGSGNKRSRKNSDGTEEVWSADVEEAFHQAIKVVPKLGRRKMQINGKLCGRNELIAEHIYKLTGKRRTRKQISSHIQVLKNTHKNDHELMKALVDPVFEEDGKADQKATMPAVRSHRLSNVSITSDILMDPGLSPQSGSPTDSSSMMPITPSYMSSARGSFESSASSRPSAYPGFATSHLGSPTVVSGFSIWASGPIQTIPAHYYAKATFPIPSPHAMLDVVFFEDLPMADIRYAQVKYMYDTLPCQFLHIESQLVLPPLHESSAILEGAQSMCASLFLSSVQELDLRCVTTVYWLGEAKSTTDVPVDLIETRANDEHPYQYTAPFMPQFWSYLLEGSRSNDHISGVPSDKQDDREEIFETVRGMSVVQKFVVASPYSAHAAGQHAHQQIDDTHVALVVTWDFECVQGRHPGGAKISKLMTRRMGNPSPAHHHMAIPASHSSALPHTMPQPFGQLPPPPMGPGSAPRSAGRRHKPGLSVSIPPLRGQPNIPAPMLSVTHASDMTSAGFNMPSSHPPITPLDQVMHTPLQPPEIPRTIQPTRRGLQLYAPTPTECVHPSLPEYAEWSAAQRRPESTHRTSGEGMLVPPGAEDLNRPRIRTGMSPLNTMTRTAMGMPTPTLSGFTSPGSGSAHPMEGLMAPWSARRSNSMLTPHAPPVMQRPEYFPRLEVSQERTPSN
ncbi:TEA-domain-containing protein [Dacryopinax primogenitus]|uniref:TEA-domain-containing protein n=1 Tax=Dacryopinax primogenitus (strain DJM 731) TaxID=1858805 RepID=M5GA73_DACPD|nr:TEA-domain-containing protein [Dacryopinax primogenitus]EJU05704.1 TEA-domain-containing protein [Dacryopinax primogenitus]